MSRGRADFSRGCDYARELGRCDYWNSRVLGRTRRGNGKKKKKTAEKYKNRHIHSRIRVRAESRLHAVVPLLQLIAVPFTTRTHDTLVSLREEIETSVFFTATRRAFVITSSSYKAALSTHLSTSDLLLSRKRSTSKKHMYVYHARSPLRGCSRDSRVPGPRSRGDDRERSTLSSRIAARRSPRDTLRSD